MKTNRECLIIILVSFFYSHKGQAPYHKMLGNTNSWYLSGMYYQMGVASGEKETGINVGVSCLGLYEANGDSVVNSKNYKVFVKPDNSICPFYTPMLTLALIREDTLTRKVYMISKNQTQEQLVLDFGLNINDSIYLDYPSANMNLKPAYYKVDSIVTRIELIGPRKHFYLSRRSSTINPATGKKYIVEWIESIGAIHFPLNIIQEPDGSNFGGSTIISGLNYLCKKQQYGTFLTCKTSNALKYFQDSCSYKYFLASQNSYGVEIINSCFYLMFDYSGGLAKLTKHDQLHVFPNPADEYLSVGVEGMTETIQNITIYDSFGKKVYMQEADLAKPGNTMTLNLHDLPPGLYSLYLRTEHYAAGKTFMKE